MVRRLNIKMTTQGKNCAAEPEFEFGILISRILKILKYQLPLRP